MHTSMCHDSFMWVSCPSLIYASLLLMCCSVLQCVVVCCSVMQCVAVYTHHFSWWVLLSVLQRVTVCCSVLQCDAVCCSVLQCVAVYMHHFSRWVLQHCTGFARLVWGRLRVRRAFVYSDWCVCSVCFCSLLPRLTLLLSFLWTSCTASPARWECL